MSKGMNVLSLFDGIGCGRVALDNLGAKIDRYYSFEIDKNAIKILNNNYPDIISCGDVLSADFTQFQDIDLLLGGSPCQDLSIMKEHRSGLDGMKSSLFWKYKEALDIVKPKYFLFENVASMKDEDKKIISDALRTEPILINTNIVLPQNRERLYWTNIKLLDMKPNKKKRFRELMETNAPDKYYYNKPFTIDADKTKNIIGTIQLNTYEANRRLYNIDGDIGCLTCVSGGYQEKKIFDEIHQKPRKLTPLEYERLQGLPDNYTKGLCDGKRYSLCGNGWSIPIIEYILQGVVKDAEY